MDRIGSLLCLYAESPLHPGAGEGVGHIDRSVQRERATGFPIIQASSLKGALRAHLAGHAGHGASSPADILFGDSTTSLSFAASVTVSDARLLLRPVASARGVFAWVTCPYVLATLRRDLARCGLPGLAATMPRLTDTPSTGSKVLVSPKNPLVITMRSSHPPTPGVVVMGGFSFEACESRDTASLAGWIRESLLPLPDQGATYFADRLWNQDQGSGSLVVVHDEVFRDLTVLALEVVERNQLEDGVAKNLWAEEHLPVHTLLYAPLLFADARAPEGRLPEKLAPGKAENLRTWFEERLRDDALLQLGADESLGRGVAATMVVVDRMGSGADTRADDGSPDSDPGPGAPIVAPSPQSAEPGARGVFRKRQQRLAERAYENIEPLIPDRDSGAKYRSLVRGTPALLRASGLEGLVALLLARSKSSDADAGGTRMEARLYRHLESWIRDDGLVGIPDEVPGGSDLPLFRAIRENDTEWLRVATWSAEDLLTWQKRMAEAFLSEEG